MPRKLDTIDIQDLAVIDAAEMSADGSTPYRSGDAVITVTGATKTIVLSGTAIVNGDDPVEAGDGVTLAGNAAAGDYTVASVTDDLTLVVVEAIVDASGGTADFCHPAGATRVGVALDSLPGITGSTLQAVLQEHALHDSLVHDLAENAYLEIVRSAGLVDSVTVWTDSGKTIKIREVTVSRTGSLIDSIVSKQYDSTGVLVQTLTETVSRSGGLVQSVTSVLS